MTGVGMWRCHKCSSSRWVGWRAGPAHDGFPRRAAAVQQARAETAETIARAIEAESPGTSTRFLRQRAARIAREHGGLA